MTKLKEFLNSQDTSQDLNNLLLHIAEVCKQISSYTSRGALAGNLGAVSGQINVQDEEQKQLDVLSNQLFVDIIGNSGQVAALASEEEDGIIVMPADKRGKLLLAFDPLDGSSNIETNIPVGSIFSVLPMPENTQDDISEKCFYQPGCNQLAAGYAVYGQATVLVLSCGKGTHGFTLDTSPDNGDFILTHENITIPEQTTEFAINASNKRFWHQPVQRYIDECLQGQEGPRKQNFNMRWVGSMVADAHRILSRGGVFLYPQDNKQPPKAGRLRLLYETSPMSLVIEQAGGRASDCTSPMLDVVADSLHQRIGFAFGSREEVERIERYHNEKP